MKKYLAASIICLFVSNIGAVGLSKEELRTAINELQYKTVYNDLVTKFTHKDPEDTKWMLPFLLSGTNLTGNIIELYFLCRNVFNEMSNPKACLSPNNAIQAQKHLMLLLIRVYEDVFTTGSILQVNSYQWVYNLFAKKIANVWYPVLKQYDVNFSELLRQNEEWITAHFKNFPPTTWVCFCNNYTLYPYSISFGNTNLNLETHRASFEVAKQYLPSIKETARTKILTKIKEIDKADGSEESISNQTKWTQFLSFTFDEI